MTDAVQPTTGMRWRLSRNGGREDREFLPAALEILESPPSPVKLGLLLSICLFAIAATAWSYVSYVDIIAVAQGKLQPTGRVKIIQPLETSRVLASKVDNGQKVSAGQLLVQLDPVEATAEANAIESDLASYRAESIRRRAAIDAVNAGTIVSGDATLAIGWPAALPDVIRQREQRVYTADILQLKAQLGSLSAQAGQKRAERERLTKMIAAQTDLITTIQTRVSMRQRLLDLDAGSRLTLLDATETLQSQKTVLALQTGQLAETEASLRVFEADFKRVTDNFIADNTQRLAVAERLAGELSERFAKASARLRNLELMSPIDGTVQGLNITTVGQVVTTGQDLMRIVPEGAELEIECYLPNKDIGFVKVGDEAVVKFEAFPFTRYGTVDATVTRVASDAIPEPDAQRIEEDGTRNVRTAGGAQRTQNLVFPVTLRMTQQSIDVDGNRVSFGAGMAVTAEIRTGSRRVLEYIFSPLVRVGSEAMKER